MSEFVLLSGIGYTATVADRQVIFEERGPVFSTHIQFAFERPIEINDTPGIWYFVHLDSSSGRVPASHIEQAYRWCFEKFGKNFEPYKADLFLTPDPV